MRGVPRERPATIVAASSVSETSRMSAAASQDPLEVRLGVVVEPIGHAEAVAQRPGDAPDARRGTDHGDVLDLQRTVRAPGPLPSTTSSAKSSIAGYRISSTTWRRRWISSMNSTSPLPRAGEDSGEVAGALDGRAGGRPDLRPHLGRHDVGERRLAQARRAVQQDVVDRLGPMLRGVDQDRQVLLDPILPGELVEPPRADGRLERELLLGDLGGRDALDRHRSGANSNM